MESSEIFYKFYDSLYAGKDYAGEVRFLMELASGRHKIQRVLEIGSGTGNHTMCCAQLGYEVLGVDIDRQMVAIAKDKRRVSPREQADLIRYFNGRVEDLPPDKFDLAFAMFNVVNYLLSLSELQLFMNSVCVRLKPGAGFIFDAWNGIAVVMDPPKEEIRDVENETYKIRVKLRSETDLMRLQTNVIHEFEGIEKKSGQQINGTHVTHHALWPPKVIQDAAGIAGFDVEAIYPYMDAGRRAAQNDWKIFFHCTKSQ